MAQKKKPRKPEPQKKPPRAPLTIDQLLESLTRNGGWIAPAAQSLGISRQALHKRIKGNKKLQAAVLDMRESYLDLAESKVVRAINDGKPWAICFYLKCQGKARGWIETRRQELTDGDGNPLIPAKAPAVITSDMSPEEATRIYTEHLKNV